MREDATAAQAMGVDVARYQLGALFASAVLAGLAGALAAHTSSFIGPNEYGFEPAVTILSYALLGGIGTPIAPVLGACILTVLPELLRGLSDLAAGAQRRHHRHRRAVPARTACCRSGCGGARHDRALETRGLDPPLRRPAGGGRASTGGSRPAACMR